MRLKDSLARSGDWLFRWRSFLPLLLVGVFFLGLEDIAGRPVGEGPGGRWQWFCLAVSFLGLGLRVLTIGYVPRGTSGRNTRYQDASVLNTTGMYSVVRNPLYLGNFVIWLGLALMLQLPWLTGMIILIFWLYYERIIFAEEKFLEEKFGEQFAAWAEKTPVFFPRWRSWVKPEMPFSLKTVLRREYSGFFAIIASFTFLELLRVRALSGRWELEGAWLLLFAAGLVIYLSLRYLKKRTTWLHVEGR